MKHLELKRMSFSREISNGFVYRTVEAFRRNGYDVSPVYIDILLKNGWARETDTDEDLVKLLLPFFIEVPGFNPAYAVEDLAGGPRFLTSEHVRQLFSQMPMKHLEALQDYLHRVRPDLDETVRQVCGEIGDVSGQTKEYEPKRGVSPIRELLYEQVRMSQAEESFTNSFPYDGDKPLDLLRSTDS
jgi:hypothetical protein